MRQIHNRGVVAQDKTWILSNCQHDATLVDCISCSIKHRFTLVKKPKNETTPITCEGDEMFPVCEAIIALIQYKKEQFFHSFYNCLYDAIDFAIKSNMAYGDLMPTLHQPYCPHARYTH